MVKRTLVVLGILTLVAMAGTSFAMNLGGPAPAQSWITAFPGGCGDCLPMYCPAECPEPESRTIVKTWSAKIEGPCPAPGMACGGGLCAAGGRPGQLLGSLMFLAGSLATPFDWLFGGLDGVYGCCPGLGDNGPCSPGFGPIPGAVHGVLSAISPPTIMFGCYW